MRNTRYNIVRAEAFAARKEARRRYLHAAYKPTVTMGLDGRRGTVNVYYGLGRGQFTNRGQMAAIVGRHGAFFSYTDDQSKGAPERVVHGDILAIGDDLYRVHCPADYRATMPALHRI